MRQATDTKEHAKKWLDAERTLILKGVPLKLTRPNVVRRVQVANPQATPSSLRLNLTSLR